MENLAGNVVEAESERHGSSAELAEKQEMRQDDPDEFQQEEKVFMAMDASVVTQTCKRMGRREN